MLKIQNISKISFCVLLTNAFFSQLTLAGELQREYRSAQFLGQGDTGISSASGSDAVFYNPAGIAQGSGVLGEINVISPQAEGTSNLKLLADEVQNKNNSNALDFLAKNQNEVFSVAAQNYTGIIFRRVALGVLERFNANVAVNTDFNSGLPMANLYAANRTGAYFTLARDFYNGSILLGFTGKYLQKREVELNISILDAQSLLESSSVTSVFKSYLHQGSGVGADIGIMFILNKESQTNFGVVYRNMGMRYRWSIPAGTQNPTEEPQVVDIGFNTSFGTKKSRVKVSVDLRDLANIQKTIIGKRTHFGIQYSLNNLFGFMGGFNQGYGTFGAFLNFRILRFDAGGYAEELGSGLGDLPSVRYYGRVSLGWFI